MNAVLSDVMYSLTLVNYLNQEGKQDKRNYGDTQYPDTQLGESYCGIDSWKSEGAIIYNELHGANNKKVRVI